MPEFCCGYKQRKIPFFDKDVDRLDSFLGSYMKADVNYVSSWKVCRIIFLLSHG